ncbi:MAG: ABC transporter permease [Acetobacteraceae bacterium]
MLGWGAGLGHVVALSLAISLGATLAASLIGLPLGATLAIRCFPGRGGVVLLANALLGLPPVVVGLALYLLLSRAGPLGGLGWLFTPGAMLLAQFVLALPITVALAHRASSGVWREYGDELQIVGAGLARSILTVLSIGRTEILTVVLAAFGRTVSEVGAILVVGGNIAGYTRTMTTSIVLETSQGNLARALGLGGVLISISLAVSAAAFALARERRA